MLASMPTVRIGAAYMASPIVVNSLSLQPRRIQFELASAAALLPISVQIACRGPFLFGWLLVPETIQTVIATAAERIRVVGPSYWALPLAPGFDLPAPEPGPARTRTAEREPNPESAPVRAEAAPDPAPASAAAKPPVREAAPKPGTTSAKPATETAAP